MNKYFYRSQDIIFEMMERRGNAISKENKFSIEDFEDMLKNNNDLTIHNDDTLISWKLCIDAQYLKQIFQLILKNNITTWIIIHSKKIAPITIQRINEIQNCFIQIFNVNELQVNIIKNNLIPRHVLLTNKEEEQLLKEYNIKKNQLPFILSADKIVKYYGWKKGRIIKIYRDKTDDMNTTDNIDRTDDNIIDNIIDMTYRVIV